uniref:Uncharacterized protein n=1 Tax=Populus trichocarpa TaxID=3694 RepID=A0A2K1ZSU5_POPTR
MIIIIQGLVVEWEGLMSLGIVGSVGLVRSVKWGKGGNSGSFGISNFGSSGIGNSGSLGNSGLGSSGNSGFGSSGNVTSKSWRASTRIVWLIINDMLMITISGEMKSGKI